MPVPFPAPRAPLHLYRHLLREASYLPPVCSPFVTDRIRSRFRSHRHASDRDAAARRAAKARHDLRFLRAANAGDMARMHRVLLFCFGRVGPRRRDLVARLVKADPPADSAALAEVAAGITRERGGAAAAAGDGPPESGRAGKADFLDRWDTSKVLALARMQAPAGITHSPRPTIKSDKLDANASIPETGIWGRPLHPKVRRTKEKKWWKALINRVLPPVEHGEWAALGALARGERGDGLSWEMPPRRPPARPLVGTAGAAGLEHAGKQAPWDWKLYVDQPVRSVERKSSRRFKLLTGADESATNAYAGGTAVDAHAYTPRLWRRMYARVWQMTPTMERPAGAGKDWTVTWGKLDTKLPSATEACRDFFRGVDARGRVPREPRSK